MGNYPGIFVYYAIADFWQGDTVWIKDLDLRQFDKDVIAAKAGMLSDRHIYAAHKLLHIQFPKFEGFHSTLLIQHQCFPSVTSDLCSGMLCHQLS